MLPAILIVLSAATQFTTLQPSHLVMEGDSNLRSWRCRSTSLEASLDSDRSLAEVNATIDRIGAETEIDAAGVPVPRFHLRIPVAAIRCGNRLMEREMLRALRGRAHPVIEFHLREVTGAIRREPDGGPYRATVAGDLSVAGASRRITIEVLGWRLTPESFYVRAAVPLRMRDFGVTPPTALLGLIRARNDINVYFDLRLRVKGSD